MKCTNLDDIELIQTLFVSSLKYFQFNYNNAILASVCILL